jgi:hypothetical protein
MDDGNREEVWVLRHYPALAVIKEILLLRFCRLWTEKHCDQLSDGGTHAALNLNCQMVPKLETDMPN